MLEYLSTLILTTLSVFVSMGIDIFIGFISCSLNGYNVSLTLLSVYTKSLNPIPICCNVLTML